MNAIHQVHLNTLWRSRGLLRDALPQARLAVPPVAAGRGGEVGYRRQVERQATASATQRATPTTSRATTRPATSARRRASAHRCDKWVSDKGPSGKCLGAHPRTKCANPNRCDAKVEPGQQ